MHNPQGDRAPETPRREKNRNESALRQERADLVRGVLARRNQGTNPQPNLDESISVGHSRAPQPEPGQMPPLPPLTNSPALAAAAAEESGAATAEEQINRFTVTVNDVIPETLALLDQWEADTHQREARAAQAAESGDRQADDSSELERVLRETGGAIFLRQLIDDVIRPDDRVAAGNGLADLSDRIPDTVTGASRRLLTLGTFAGAGAPFIAVPLAKRVTHRLFDAELVRARKLSERIEAVHRDGYAARVRPLCEPVLGENGFNALQERLLELAGHDELVELEMAIDNLDYLDNDWDFDGNADRAAMRLAAILLAATEGNTPTYVQLRVTSASRLELAVETFMRALDVNGLEQARAGIEIPADYPESAPLLRRLAGWAHLRREDGGSAIRVAITRRPGVRNELAEAKLRSMPPLCYTEPEAVDANAVRLIDEVLAPEHHGTLELEVGINSQFDAALALQLARKRGALAPVSALVPAGTPKHVVERLRAAGAAVRVRLGLLPESGLRAGTRYLRSLLAEHELQRSDTVHTPETDLSPASQRLLAAVDLVDGLPVGRAHVQQRVNPEDAPNVTASIPFDIFPPGLFSDEPEAPRPDWSESFVAAQPITIADDPNVTEAFGHIHDSAVDDSDPVQSTDNGDSAASRAEASATTANDTAVINPADTGAQPDLTEVVLGLRRGRPLRNTFRNEPVSDHTQPEVREWALRVIRRAAHSELGITEAAADMVESTEAISTILDQAHRASEHWSATSGWERAARLDTVARALEANRARLIEVAISETGFTFAEADRDVSDAIDLTNHAAHLARQLDRMQGARFEPVRVSLVVPGWIPPVGSTCAAIVAALAAGSAVVVKPSPRTPRTAAILVRVLWAAGVDEQLLHVASCDERLLTDEQLGEQLITDHRVERVLLQGTYETARRFLEWRADLPLVGMSGGKSSVIVTPSADYDLAAFEIARSVVASLGQRAARPSNAILVGSVARSARFTAQLADAIAAVRIGYPSDPAVHVGPLVSRATVKQVEALTELAEGERWLLEPRALDDAGRLWTPGIRVGVQPDSPSARQDAPVPVINLITADSLTTATEIQNRIDYGLGAGLFALDRAEIAEWVQLVRAGNLYINREMIDGRVQRQPIGGWGRSMIGTKMKSGGPNSLVHLGRWRAEPGEQSHTLHLRGLEDSAQRLIEAMQVSLDFDAFERVRTTAVSCQIAWNEEFGEVVDRANLGVERNLFRYRPTECLIRAAENASFTELAQVLVAVTVARAPVLLSLSRELPRQVADELALRGARVRLESDEQFSQRMRQEGLREALRMRLVGGSRSAVCRATKNIVDIALFSDDVTLAGRLEMLPFLREQSISITANRFGYPDDRVMGLFPHEREAEQL